MQHFFRQGAVQTKLEWVRTRESSIESEYTRPESKSEPIRSESESIRGESESIGPESESSGSESESESESNKSQSESPDSAWTHESNSRKRFVLTLYCIYLQKYNRSKTLHINKIFIKMCLSELAWKIQKQ